MRKILNINEGWKFYKDTQIITDTFEDISLPHTWNNYDGQDGGNDYFRGHCLYQKTFLRTDLPNSRLYFLEINGSNASATVYLNNIKLASHDGGYSTWRVNLTNHLQNENDLRIIVENTVNETVYPQTADFTFYGGLYRDVNIICVEDSHFALEELGTPGIKVTPKVENQNAVVLIETEIINKKEDQILTYTIKNQEGEEIYSTSSKDTTVSLPIENVHLWHGRKDPYLYSIDVEILENDVIIDHISSKFGCRTFHIDPEKGFYLNGESYPLRGVSRHQDRFNKGNALSKEDHDEDMALICEVGANTIRLAHYQHDQYFYDLCDQYGMVIWAEVPYISRHMPTGNENVISQMKELIIQNYNHPSIVVWGLSNEITMDGPKDKDMLKLHYTLNDLVHQMDSTRLTTMACISMCGMDEEIVHIPDVVAYNHYFGWYGGDVSQNGKWFDEFHKKYPNKAIGMSEYGCEGLHWHSSKPSQGDYTEEYQAYYHEELIKQLFTREYIWATHVWNMFDFGADARSEGGEYGQNHKGLITMDRKYKKDSFYAYKAWLSVEPFVHICSKGFVDRVEDRTKVTVYSNLPEVELFVNGVSVGRQTSDVHFFYFEIDNIDHSELKAVAGECSDESHIQKVDQPNESYILKEKGAVLNWFDVIEIEGKLSLNDKMEDVLKTFKGKLWFFKLLLIMGKKMNESAAKQQKPSKKTKKKKKNTSLDNNTMDLIKSFTVLRFTSLVSMRNVNFTKEELLKFNSQLNKIDKKK